MLLSNRPITSGNTWALYFIMINRKRHRTTNEINFGSKYITADQDTGYHMNKSFCEITNKVKNAIPNSGYNYKRYLSISVEKIFFLNPTNIDGILNEDKNLNPRKSCGPDNIGAKVVQLCPMKFVESLCLIYNTAIKMVKRPMARNVAKII